MASWRSEALLDVLSQEQTRDIGGSTPGALQSSLLLSQEQTKEIAGTPPAALRRHNHEAGMHARAQPAARKSSTR